MSLKFTNSSIKREQIKDTVQNLGKSDRRSTKPRNKNITNLNADSAYSVDEDYSEINILSFKQSFSRLQRNYSVDNLK